MNIDTGRFRSALQIQNEYLSGQVQERKTKKQSDSSFQEIFTKQVKDKNETAEALKFSKHACSRLLDRGIKLTENQVERLNEGAKKAMTKGIQESLVLVDDFAFIINVKNSTVITAMDHTETNENVFTNIDGAVIM